MFSSVLCSLYLYHPLCLAGFLHPGQAENSVISPSLTGHNFQIKDICMDMTYSEAVRPKKTWLLPVYFGWVNFRC